MSDFSFAETESFGEEYRETGKHCLKCLVPGLLKVPEAAVLKGRARLSHACVGVGHMLVTLQNLIVSLNKWYTQ